MKRYATVILLALVWAAYYAALSIVNKTYDPFFVGAMIRFIVFVLLSAWLLHKRTYMDLFRVGRALPHLILIGCMGFLLDITVFFGFQHSSAATGTILLKLDVIFVSVISLVLYKERLSLIDWLCIAAMLFGTLLILQIDPTQMTFSLSDVLFIASAAFISINAFLIKAVQKRSDVSISNDTIAFYNNFMTMLLFLGFLLLSGRRLEFSLLIENGAAVLSLLVAALGQYFVYVLYYKGLRTLPVWIVKTILLFIPVFALLWDILIFNTLPTLTKLCGTGIVLLGAAGIILQRRTPDKPAILHEKGA